jgi:hypothetical protein
VYYPIVPREIDDILDGVEHVPSWRKVMQWEVLRTAEGVAILRPSTLQSEWSIGLVSYTDGALVDLGAGPSHEQRVKAEHALRERPSASPWIPLLSDDEEVERVVAEPPRTEEPVLRPKPPPRVWTTTPILSGDED